MYKRQTVDSNVSFTVLEDEEGFLLGYGLFSPVSVLLSFIGVSTLKRGEWTGREEDCI